MRSFSRTEVVLVRYPFSDLSAAKVRPAIVVSGPRPSDDLLVVPLTSRTAPLRPGEFLLAGWQGAGLNVASAVKRGIFSVHESLVVRSVGFLSPADAKELDRSLRTWLQL